MILAAVSPRQRQILYLELAKLLHSGRAIPAAIETLAAETHGSIRRLLRAVQQRLRAGDTVGSAFAAQKPISRLEGAIISAGERSGQLVSGCEYLSRHFGALAEMREVVIRRSTYPLFILVFGTFLLGLPALFTEGAAAYVEETVGFLVAIALIAGAVAGVTALLRSAARTSSAADGFLRGLPPFGKIRRSFCLARFCSTYRMYLDSGINVIDSLLAAADVSQSALIRKATDAAVPGLRRGEQLAPLLKQSRIFPERFLRSLRIGEETGGLDRELAELTEEFQRAGARRVETLSEWLPRILYLLIVCYMGYRIVQTYSNTLDQLEKAMEF